MAESNNSNDQTPNSKSDVSVPNPTVTTPTPNAGITPPTVSATTGHNRIGLTKDDYKGAKSTLCTGCGHDSISSNIMSAFFQSGIDPYSIAKMSGIGCSSKTPAYFISKASGFNTLHGRMPSTSTGVKLANSTLKLIGISGDGDTASIGMGQFVHMIRRNLPITYIVANNGVYGLTKGQFSATSEKGAKLKSGDTNAFGNIDICSLALELGCTFVARSFSGDPKHLIPLISAAMQHPGTAVIDVISPCVTFNNQADSLKSYDYMKEHKVTLQELGFIESFDTVQVDIKDGATESIQLPDGSTLTLRKLDSRTHNVRDRFAAQSLLWKSKNSAELLLGLFYISTSETNLVDSLSLPSTPLSKLTESTLRPTHLTEILEEYI
jgi:2-oxoglutarate ferredoxin oxidoreductase subunit beta